LPSDVWNNLTTSSSKNDDLMLNRGREHSLRVINSVIGVVGTLDNLFVIITFGLFIKITDKVMTILQYYATLLAGLLMRPEHSETKAKTKTRKCKTEIETETETKNYETETETSLVNSVAYESKPNRYAFVIDYIFETRNTFCGTWYLSHSHVHN